MTLLVVLIAVWCAVSVPFGIVVGKCIRFGMGVDMSQHDRVD